MTEKEDHTGDRELEMYRIRYGLYKVIFGTAIVGLAGVLVPGAIEFWQLRFEDRRRAAEIETAQISQQQDYVKDFLATALDQDIELRIRFADYFAHVAADPYREDWKDFRDSLIQLRDKNRKEINERELALWTALAEKDPSAESQAEAAKLLRELEWRYEEVGYVAKDRRVERVQGDKPRQSLEEALQPMEEFRTSFPMPDVVGLTVEEAEQVVLSAGRSARATSARAVIVGRRPGAAPPGQIIQQLTSPGSPLRPYRDDVGGVYGQVVFRVVVSSDPDEVTD